MDSILIVVDQKDRALETACSTYILKPIALLSTSYTLVDDPIIFTLHCLTTTENYGSKPHLSITHKNFMQNTQFSKHYVCMYNTLLQLL